MKAYRNLAVLLYLMVFTASVLICGCSLDDEDIQTSTFATYDLELLDWDVDWDEETIFGRIKNNGGSDTSAEITANFFNDNGEMVGSNFDIISNLPAGEVWKFEIWFGFYDDVVSVKLSGIDEY